MTFWLLVYIYFEFPCQFWQSFTSFWGSYEDFVGTPQNCAKIKKFWIFSIFLLLIIIWTKCSRNGDDMVTSYYDAISVSNCVIFKTISFLRLSMQFSILLAVFVCLFGSYITHFVVLFHWFINFWIGFKIKFYKKFFHYKILGNQSFGKILLIELISKLLKFVVSKFRIANNCL